MDESHDAGYHLALASPVRRQVLARLQASPSALTAATLAAGLGLHVTTVRFHLDTLEQAGLVTREPGHERRRGRPSVRYRASPGDPDTARDDLIRVLTETVATHSPSTAADALAAGERWADLLDAPPTDTRTAVTVAFARLGFDPEPDGNLIRLRACPFRAAAREHPEVVCRVHLGLAQRLADLQPDGPARIGLQPFVEPELCVLTVAASR